MLSLIVVGTVAGDDTVLMIVDKTTHAAGISTHITQLGNVDSIFLNLKAFGETRLYLIQKEKSL